MPAADITVSAIVPATTPVAVLAGAGALVVLLAALLVLRRRRRHARTIATMRGLLPDVDAGLVVDLEGAEAAEVDPSEEHQPEAAPEGVRALRLLVRTLESTIEEQQAELARLQDAGPDHSAAPALPPAWDFEAPAAEEQSVEDRRARTVAHALREVPAEDRAARLNAALARTGIPISFTRPVLAACPGLPLPGSLPTPVAAASPVEVAEPQVPTRPTLVPQLESTPEPTHLEAAPPVEDQRVLPVPAPPAPTEAPRRRRLFRSTAA